MAHTMANGVIVIQFGTSKILQLKLVLSLETMVSSSSKLKTSLMHSRLQTLASTDLTLYTLGMTDTEHHQTQRLTTSTFKMQTLTMLLLISTTRECMLPTADGGE